MRTNHSRDGVDDAVQQFEELEDRILDELATVRKLKKIVVERFQERRGASPDDTAVIMNTGFIRRPSVYENAILSILKDAGRRMTFAPLILELQARGYTCHAVTIKRHLKHLMKTKRIDNSKEADPPGYGII